MFIDLIQALSADYKTGKKAFEETYNQVLNFIDATSVEEINQNLDIEKGRLLILATKFREFYKYCIDYGKKHKKDEDPIMSAIIGMSEFLNHPASQLFIEQDKIKYSTIEKLAWEKHNIVDEVVDSVISLMRKKDFNPASYFLWCCDEEEKFNQS